ncbi:MAG: elongation factor P [Bacteroidales bacterium]|nr:elongation factor P [Bacteroidales bacterium]
MATTADFKNGMCIEFNGKLYTITHFLHVKPGKGAAFVRTKLKNVETGKVIENTFNAGLKINQVRIETREYQYLYKEESGFVFMNLENYDQITLPEHKIENADLYKDGIIVQIIFHAEKEEALLVNLPPFIESEVTYTEPGLKGDTASSNALKPATIETGATIMVPLFVNQGDVIKIDTRDRSYSERVK